MTRQTHEMLSRLESLGLSTDDALALRRASMTLSRWAELECGDGNDNGSWAIERDNQIGWKMDRRGCVEDATHVPTDKPFLVHHHYYHGKRPDTTTRHATPDREKGALNRVNAICDANGLHFYHQGDPRGAALYVSDKPLTDSDYSNGVAVYK